MLRTSWACLVLFLASAALAACSSPGAAPDDVDSGVGTDSGPGSDAGDSGPAISDAGQDAGSDAGPDAGTCDPLAGTGGNQECRMCVLNAGTCASDLSTYETDCSSYTTCICQCGGGTTCAATCLRSSTTAACKTALESVESCGEQACPSQCSLPDAGTPPDGGTWCGVLATCCATLDGGMEASLCNGAVTLGNETRCEQALTAAQGQGLCE